jgi:hypothetical protein
MGCFVYANNAQAYINYMQFVELGYYSSELVQRLSLRAPMFVFVSIWNPEGREEGRAVPTI